MAGLDTDQQRRRVSRINANSGLGIVKLVYVNRVNETLIPGDQDTHDCYISAGSNNVTNQPSRKTRQRKQLNPDSPPPSEQT